MRVRVGVREGDWGITAFKIQVHGGGSLLFGGQCCLPQSRKAV